MTYQIDSRILSSNLLIDKWELSDLYLKNESRFPWFILIPRITGAEEIHQLTTRQQVTLMTEISHLSKIIRVAFKPDKLNVASLGNIVPTLHIHVVGRYKTDPFWPHGIWQSEYELKPYTENALNNLQTKMQSLLKDFQFFAKNF